MGTDFHIMKIEEDARGDAFQTRKRRAGGIPTDVLEVGARYATFRDTGARVNLRAVFPGGCFSWVRAGCPS